MTKRQFTRIKVEVEFILPVGKRPPWGVEAVQSRLRIPFTDEPALPELNVRLVSKETTYL